MKREDKRKADELRPVEMKVGVLKQADGSAMVRIGKTVAIAAVYGPRELNPRHRQESDTAILQCTYTMAPFSTKEWVRPGPSRRSV